MEREPTTETELIEELAVLRKEVKVLKALSSQAKTAEDDYSRFFSQSLDLLCIRGFDGYFKCTNPAWTSCLGWTPEELKARPILDFVHPDDLEATRSQFDASNKGVDTILFENRYRHKDGSYRWLRWSARSGPERQGIYANARDVTQQKLLEKTFLEIADMQKERFGYELHDGLCQTLAGIAALSATLSRKLKLNAESDAAADAAEINKLLNDAIGEAHDMARDLGPMALSGVSLEATLETMANNTRDRFGVPCTFECDCPMGRLGHEVEVQLYRIAQEAVSNAVNHSGAKRIEITLSAKDGNGLLSIRDDGVGVPDGADHAEGVGMHSMAYRSRLIGAHLELKPRTPCGTGISCVFPISERQDRGEAPE